jgi:hypothetical protein
MQYKLISNTQKGVLTDRTPVMRDIKDTFEASFLLPAGGGAYVALFLGEDGVEHKAVIRCGRVKIPREILSKEQYVGLTVCEVNGERVIRSWECEPLKVTAFLYLRQTQWRISGGMTDKDCLDRLAELESVHAKTLEEFDELRADAARKDGETRETLSKLCDIIAAQNGEDGAEVKSLKKRLNALSEDFMQSLAGEAVPDLAERKIEFRAAHNRLRELQGKEKRNITEDF